MSNKIKAGKLQQKSRTVQMLTDSQASFNTGLNRCYTVRANRIFFSKIKTKSQ